AAHVAHVAGEALAGPEARGALVRRHRARVAPALGAVRAEATREVVALDDARVAVALGRADHVDELRGSEHRVDLDRAARLGELVPVLEAHFLEEALRRRVVLLEVADRRLVRAGRPLAVVAGR